MRVPGHGTCVFLSAFCWSRFLFTEAGFWNDEIRDHPEQRNGNDVTWWCRRQRTFERHDVTCVCCVTSVCCVRKRAIAGGKSDGLASRDRHLVDARARPREGGVYSFMEGVVVVRRNDLPTSFYFYFRFSLNFLLARVSEHEILSLAVRFSLSHPAQHSDPLIPAWSGPGVSKLWPEGRIRPAKTLCQ